MLGHRLGQAAPFPGDKFLDGPGQRLEALADLLESQDESARTVALRLHDESPKAGPRHGPPHPPECVLQHMCHGPEFLNI